MVQVIIEVIKNNGNLEDGKTEKELKNQMKTTIGQMVTKNRNYQNNYRSVKQNIEN